MISSTNVSVEISTTAHRPCKVGQLSAGVGRRGLREKEERKTKIDEGKPHEFHPMSPGKRLSSSDKNSLLFLLTGFVFLLQSTSVILISM